MPRQAQTERNRAAGSALPAEQRQTTTTTKPKAKAISDHKARIYPEGWAPAAAPEGGTPSSSVCEEPKAEEESADAAGSPATPAPEVAHEIRKRKIVPWHGRGCEDDKFLCDGNTVLWVTMPKQGGREQS